MYNEGLYLIQNVIVTIALKLEASNFMITIEMIELQRQHNMVTSLFCYFK